MKRTLRLVASLGCALSLSGCHDDAASSDPINLGAPRQLLYVADDTSAAKHGGASAGMGMIHAFDLATFAHVGMFEAGNGVGEIHATPDGAYLWMVATTEGTVSLFDTTSYALTELDVGVRPVHTFISSTHDEIWVGNDGSADVSIISIADRAVTATVITGSGHHKMAVVPGATGLDSVYVSNITDGTITPVGANHVARTNVPGTGPVPHGMDYSALTRRVYNCSGDAMNSIEVIATTDEPGTAENERDTIVARVALPVRCSFLHVSDDGAFAYATLPSGNLLARVRLADHHVDTFPTGSGPDRFELVGEHAYVANALSPDVSVIDLTGLAPTLTIGVGNAQGPAATEGHRGVRYHQNRLYVPNAYDGTVSVIDTTSNAVIATLSEMHAPVAVAIAGPGFGTTYPR